MPALSASLVRGRYKTELMGRVEFAEARSAQLTALRDEASALASSLKEQLIASQERTSRSTPCP